MLEVILLWLEGLKVFSGKGHLIEVYPEVVEEEEHAKEWGEDASDIWSHVYKFEISSGDSGGEGRAGDV